MLKNIKQNLIDWLSREEPPSGLPLCDFERLSYELRVCDVLLVEGRSRVSDAIRMVTQSPWSHACLYIGRLHDIDDIELRKRILEFCNAEPDEQLVIEGYLGRGTIVTPLEVYKKDHLRICRPRGISRRDSQQVMAHAIHQLGTDYDVRQILDLARFMVPWSVLPRKWRSSLFEHGMGETTRTVCSTMLAEAFAAINFPILPLVKQHEETGIELIQRNSRIFTPKDFDYSPYFDIIKYPFIELEHAPTYRNLPWNEALISNDRVGVTSKKSRQTPKTQDPTSSAETNVSVPEVDRSLSSPEEEDEPRSGSSDSSSTSLNGPLKFVKRNFFL
ncbi:MAG: YiiX/YebB-like N1pC/P60 family cysteine hydrolase [Gammaproteobacteria bacterium]